MLGKNREIRKHLLEVTLTVELPKQNHPDVMNAVLPPRELPRAPARWISSHSPAGTVPTSETGWPMVRSQ